MDVTGADRQLGVPPPAKPVATVTVSDEITWEEAETWLRTTGGPAIRKVIGQHMTQAPTGAYTNHGLLYPNDPLVPAALQTKTWCLIARVVEPTPGSADNPYGLWGSWLLYDLGAMRGADNAFYIPLPCVPIWFKQNNTTLVPALNALKGPDGATPLLTESMVTTLTNGLTWELDDERAVGDERTELDALVKEFARILATPDEALGVTLPAPPTAPAKPVTVPYSYGVEGGG